VTVFESADRAARIMSDAGFAPEDARGDVSVLARHALGWTTAEWAMRLKESAPPGFADRIVAMASRRARHEPVAYITETREFYGRPFHVTPSVLIPRPETEGLIDEALKLRRHNSRPLIVDVGTGSGCIAVTLALEWPDSRVVATDISTAALDVARSNARALDASSVEFVQVSADEFVPAHFTSVDLVVSNPPYVPERDRQSLPADVREFEPHTALFAGADGLDLIRLLIPAAAKSLARGGILLMEIGAGQAGVIPGLVRHAGLELVDIRPDLQGIPRTVVARLPTIARSA
jgi:release factor glutamine methyltransferase